MATVPISDGDPKNSYTAAAGQTIFPYTFWIRDASHIAVFVNGTRQTLTSDYTVSGVQSPTGANVVFNSGRVEDDAVTLVYDPPFERTSEFTGALRLEALNTELTYLLTLLQSNQRKIDDAIRTGDTELVNFDGSLPELTGNGGRLLGIKSDLSGLEYVTVAASDSIISNYEDGSFSGTGAQTLFTLPFTPAAQNALLVWLGGVRQRPGVDYTVSGDSLVFTTAPSLGTNNITYLNTSATTSVNTPGDGSVTTAKLANGAVTTPKIAAQAVSTPRITDNAVTLDKMEHGTQGDILYYGTSGEPLRLGAGTAGQVLETTGAGGNPRWADQMQGGLVLLGSYTASNVASVDIGAGLDLDAAVDGSYDSYVLKMINLVPATDGADLYLRVSTDGGSSFISTSSYEWLLRKQETTVDTRTSGTPTVPQIELADTLGNGTGESYTGSLEMFTPSNVSFFKKFRHSSTMDDAGNRCAQIDGGARFTSLLSYNAARIFLSSGNISSGTFHLYGVRSS